MFNFHIFKLKDIISLLQKYNLKIQKSGYTLYGKYKDITLFEGSVSDKADKILNIQMTYDLSIYNGEIMFIGNYYPITLENIESKLKSFF